jgi:hypothetical protein
MTLLTKIKHRVKQKLFDQFTDTEDFVYLEKIYGRLRNQMIPNRPFQRVPFNVILRQLDNYDFKPIKQRT